jgi:hypothetical protein
MKKRKWEGTCKEGNRKRTEAVILPNTDRRGLAEKEKKSKQKEKNQRARASPVKGRLFLKTACCREV